MANHGNRNAQHRNVTTEAPDVVRRPAYIEDALLDRHPEVDERLGELHAAVHLRRGSAVGARWASFPAHLRGDARRIAAAFAGVAFFDAAPVADIELVASCMELVRRLELERVDSPRFGTLASLTPVAQAFYHAFLTVYFERMAADRRAPGFFGATLTAIVTRFRHELDPNEPMPPKAVQPGATAMTRPVEALRALWPRVTLHPRPRKTELSTYRAAATLAREFDIAFPATEADARASRRSSRAPTQRSSKAR